MPANTTSYEVERGSSSASRLYCSHACWSQAWFRPMYRCEALSGTAWIRNELANGGESGEPKNVPRVPKVWNSWPMKGEVNGMPLCWYCTKAPGQLPFH